MKVYAVGVGPGDPELVTVKAAKLLSEAGVVVVPFSSNKVASLAERVISPYVRGKIVRVKLPMRREVEEEELNTIANSLCSELKDFKEAVYVTLGDPTLYSTVFRLIDRMPCMEEKELVPGVTSFTACASRASMSLALGGDAVAVVPADRRDVLSKAVGVFETIVIMKGSMGLRESMRLLEGYDVIYARRCFMDEETLGKEIVEEDYFSMLIARVRKDAKR